MWISVVLFVLCKFLECLGTQSMAYRPSPQDNYISINNEKVVTLLEQQNLYKYVDGDLLKISCASAFGEPYFRNLQAPPPKSLGVTYLRNYTWSTMIYKRLFEFDLFSINCVLSPAYSIFVMFTASRDLPDLYGFEVNKVKLHAKWIDNVPTNVTYEYYPGEILAIRFYDHLETFTVSCNASYYEDCLPVKSICRITRTFRTFLNLNFVAVSSTVDPPNKIVCHVHDPEGATHEFKLFLVLDTFRYYPYISGLSMSHLITKIRSNETFTAMSYVVKQGEHLNLKCQQDLHGNSKKEVFFEYDKGLGLIQVNFKNEPNTKTLRGTLRLSIGSAKISCYYFEKSPIDNSTFKVLATVLLQISKSDGLDNLHKNTDIMNHPATYYNINQLSDGPISIRDSYITTSTEKSRMGHGATSSFYSINESIYYNNYSYQSTSFSHTTVRPTTSSNTSKEMFYYSNETLNDYPKPKQGELLNKVGDSILKAKFSDDFYIVFGLLCATIVIAPPLTFAIIKWRKGRRKRDSERNVPQNARIQPERNSMEHIYETIPEPTDEQEHSSTSEGISQRPPEPLPTEAQTKKYIHYDTPYDFRIFRIGVPVIYVPSRFKKTCHQV